MCIGVVFSNGVGVHSIIHPSYTTRFLTPTPEMTTTRQRPRYSAVYDHIHRKRQGGASNDPSDHPRHPQYSRPRIVRTAPVSAQSVCGREPVGGVGQRASRRRWRASQRQRAPQSPKQSSKQSAKQSPKQVPKQHSSTPTVAVQQTPTTTSSATATTTTYRQPSKPLAKPLGGQHSLSRLDE